MPKIYDKDGKFIGYETPAGESLADGMSERSYTADDFSHMAVKKDWSVVYPNPQTGLQGRDVLPDRQTVVITLALMLTNDVVPDYVGYGTTEITESQHQDLYIDAVVLKTLQGLCEEDGCEMDELIQSFQSHEATFRKLLNSNCEIWATHLRSDKNDLLLAVATRLGRVGIQRIFNQETP